MVKLVLVQNGVLAARSCQYSQHLTKLSLAGVSIYADEYSLKSRGIETSDLSENIKATDLNLVVDAMALGEKVIWY